MIERDELLDGYKLAGAFHRHGLHRTPAAIGNDLAGQTMRLVQ